MFFVKDNRYLKKKKELSVIIVLSNKMIFFCVQYFLNSFCNLELFKQILNSYSLDISCLIVLIIRLYCAIGHINLNAKRPTHVRVRAHKRQ